MENRKERPIEVAGHGVGPLALAPSRSLLMEARKERPIEMAGEGIGPLAPAPTRCYLWETISSDGCEGGRWTARGRPSRPSLLEQPYGATPLTVATCGHP